MYGGSIPSVASNFPAPGPALPHIPCRIAIRPRLPRGKEDGRIFSLLENFIPPLLFPVIPMPRLLRFASTRDGATAIEYALIASLIAVVAMAGIVTLGDRLATMYEDVSQAVTDAL